MSWEAVSPDTKSSVIFPSSELTLISGLLSISSSYVSGMSDSLKTFAHSESVAEDCRIISSKIRVIPPDTDDIFF